MINPASVQGIIRLAALAAVVDGKASDEEKNFIVDEGSHLLRTSQDEVRMILDIWVKKYQDQGAANNPRIALGFAVDALKPLEFDQKHLAFYICDQVIHIDKEVTESELPFFLHLQRFVFS